MNNPLSSTANISNHKTMIREIMKEQPNGIHDLLAIYKEDGIKTTVSIRQWQVRGVPINRVGKLCKLSSKYTPHDFYPDIFLP